MARAAETATVSVKIIRVLLEAAEAVGLASSDLLAAAGLSRADLADPDSRVPLLREQALWDTAVELSGDPHFGLHAALPPPLHRWDVLGYAIRSSADVRQAIGQLVRYNRLVHDVAVFALQETATAARLTHRFTGALLGPNRPAAEFTLASVVHQCRLLTGAPFAPRRVWFQHPDPGGDAARVYAELFQAPVSYGASHNALELDPALLDLPLQTADPQLLPILARHGDELLSSLPTLGGWTDRVRQAVTAALPEGAVTLDPVARRLKVSPRTLQRRLAEEQTSHQAVLDEVRRGLAARYVAQPDLSLSEAAFLLGFSEPAAFRRAFKRWTGVSPSTYRKR